MSKFPVDYSHLEDKLFKKAYRFSEVKDRLETVAFDVVRFKDGDEASKLWQVQTSDDGDYIVTLYEEPETVKEAKWEVVLSKTAKAINVFYKGDPIVKIAANRLGIPENELSSVERYLPARLSQNSKLVQALLSELPEPTKNAVLNKYPELKGF